jgi:hypothetical protein
VQAGREVLEATVAQDETVNVDLGHGAAQEYGVLAPIVLALPRSLSENPNTPERDGGF